MVVYCGIKQREVEESQGCRLESGAGPGADAGPRPVWILVNTMNNIYSERPVAIDRLLLLRRHSAAQERKRSQRIPDETKTFCYFLFSLQTLQFLVLSRFHAHTIMFVLCSCCHIIRGRIRVNQQCHSGTTQGSNSLFLH